MRKFTNNQVWNVNCEFVWYLLLENLERDSVPFMC